MVLCCLYFKYISQNVRLIDTLLIHSISVLSLINIILIVPAMSVLLSIITLAGFIANSLDAVCFIMRAFNILTTSFFFRFNFYYVF